VSEKLGSGLSEGAVAGFLELLVRLNDLIDPKQHYSVDIPKSSASVGITKHLRTRRLDIHIAQELNGTDTVHHFIYARAGKSGELAELNGKTQVCSDEGILVIGRPESVLPDQIRQLLDRFAVLEILGLSCRP
jgi:hypothetical protein